MSLCDALHGACAMLASHTAPDGFNREACQRCDLKILGPGLDNVLAIKEAVAFRKEVMTQLGTMHGHFPAAFLLL